LLSFFKLTYPRRMILRKLLVSVIALPPVIITLTTLSFAYLLTVGETELFWLLLQVTIYAAVWSAYCIRERIKKLAETQFMTKYFQVDDNEIIFHEPRKNFLLEPAPISDNTALGKLWNKYLPKLAFLLFSAYPIMRLLTATGGDSALFLFLFILGAPLCVYFFARTSAGAYLWIYKIYQLEKLHGKPVLFELKKEG